MRRTTFSDLLHGKAALTPEMALRIEKAFGPDMDHLLRMQLAYDVAKTRAHARGLAIRRYAPAESHAQACAMGAFHARDTSRRSANLQCRSATLRRDRKSRRA